MKIQSDIKGKEFDSIFPLYLGYIRLEGSVRLERKKKTKLAKQYQGT